ncbi:MAG: PilN domain-containing protein [Candidatus Saccharimonadales bacterium]
MINLLPAEAKQNIYYARRNSMLKNWLLGLSCGIIGIVIITFVGLIFIDKASNDTNALIASTQSQLKSENLGQVQQQITDISNNLKVMVTVLSQEVLYSQLFKQVGSVIPSGAILTGLNIPAGATGIDLQVDTKDYQTASQVQINLEDPNNKIFSKADIVSIQCQSDAQRDSNGNIIGYPCIAQLRAQFVKNNPFLFIHSKSGSSK